MSKNNMLLGYARGKVGSLVFNRLKGQQITKAHNASPANPKSYAQMAQRCRYNTAVARYKMATNKFFRFAYEDKRPHESYFNAFMRHNMMAEPYSTNDMAKKGFATPSPILVSSGSLSSPSVDFSLLDVMEVQVERDLTYKCFGISVEEMGAGWSDSIVFDDDISLTTERLLSNFPMLKDGDLLTFVVYLMGFDGESEDYYNRISYNDFQFAQFKLDLNDHDTLIENLFPSLPFVFDNDENAYLAFLDNSKGFDSEINACAGVMVSRKENSKVLISDCILQPNAYLTTLLDDIGIDALNEQAIASYSPATPGILNPDK